LLNALYETLRVFKVSRHGDVIGRCQIVVASVSLLHRFAVISAEFRFYDARLDKVLAEIGTGS
jgi:hypothetical protein